ncbi:hypothetical protein [Undibacterium sp. TJN19]|uniref:hypothetical protein n=1 Tax=Undibacterium sp. TJN19 TaxID=3413055 RepID=UPI003BF228B5
MKAEDILPDNINIANFAGMQIRKGTVAAFIANARIHLAPSSTMEERQFAQTDMFEALPALQAIGVLDIFKIADAGLRKLVDEHLLASSGNQT